MRRFPLLLALALSFGCSRGQGAGEDATKGRPRSTETFERLSPRAELGLDPRKVKLGRRLFDDVRLSGDETVACVSCHLRELGYANGQVRATLPTRPPGATNVPTLYNVAYDYRFDWDGEFETLESQVDALIVKPGVMRSSWGLVVPRLRADPGYAAAFREAYPAEGVTTTTVPDALIAYMRSLTTPGARFDRFLAGETGVLTDEERAGHALFQKYGCVSCHQGKNVGGNLLQKIGVMDDFFGGRALTPADRGRARVTGDPEDEHVFRVPSLRNVALTAPYFHDGSAATLDEAVRVMGRVQLGRELGPRERGQIVAFLGTLTGELEDEALR